VRACALEAGTRIRTPAASGAHGGLCSVQGERTHGGVNQLDEVFQPGDRLVEGELAEKFEVSRSPVREALQALEKEGTLIMSPYKGATVKPLSAAEVLEIAELRLALISLAQITVSG
jgi:biotin operon repressor